MTIQTADPYAPDTDLRAERDKAAGMAVVTLLLTAGPRDISITVTRRDRLSGPRRDRHPLALRSGCD